MIFWIILGLILIGILFFAMYRIVPPSEAHYVVTPFKTMVCSPDEKVREAEGVKSARWYLHIPLVRTVRKMDITTKELVLSQETIEKSQARYNVKSSVKYRVKDVKTAVETISSLEDLQEQLKEVVLGGTRAVTVKYDVVEARADKRKIDSEIRQEIQDDFAKWGLELVNFQLVDFQDTEESNIVSDISRRREVEIETRTRQENAEKFKEARLKEAQAEETAKTKEIEKDKIIAQREQDKNKEVAEREKEAEREKFEVVRVKTIQQAEIDKEQAIIDANKQKETEKIILEQKQLEGQGDKLRDIERAKGQAAPIREKGLAEAEAKEKLQAALNKFKNEAIRALVAEQIVNMQKEVGLKTAEALQKADLRVFAGGDGAKQGFDLGALISATSTGNEGTAKAVLNKIARPNDIGLGDLNLEKVIDDIKNKTKKNGNV